LLRQLLDFVILKTGPNSPTAADAMAQLGYNLLLQKKHSEAEKLVRGCLRVRDKTQPDDWTTFNTKSMLGEALLSQKKPADAEPLLVQGYDGMKQRQAKIPPQFRAVRQKEALERLVALYVATGKKDEAARFRKELDALTKAAKAPPKK
jgi:eukaryotic-like serine/threonine-protein kinase